MNGLVGSPCSPRDSSLLQHHSSKASIVQHSPLFIVRLSHPYKTTGKTIALTRRTFVGKVMFLLFNMPSSHLILCHSLLLLPPIPPSTRVFSNESALHMRWLKYCSFSFSVIPFSEHPGLISFRMDWLDLLAVQGTLKSFLQHHSSKASILQRSAFFTVQLSR